jgi:hypothetical protein
MPSTRRYGSMLAAAWGTVARSMPSSSAHRLSGAAIGRRPPPPRWPDGHPVAAHRPVSDSGHRLGSPAAVWLPSTRFGPSSQSGVVSASRPDHGDNGCRTSRRAMTSRVRLLQRKFCSQQPIPTAARPPPPPTGPPAQSACSWCPGAQGWSVLGRPPRRCRGCRCSRPGPHRSCRTARLGRPWAAPI